MGAGRFSVDTVFGAVDRMSGPMASMGAKATRFEKTLGGANKAADKVSGGLMQVAAWGTAAAIGVGGIAGSVIGVGMDFEQTMSGVAAVSGATDKQFEQLKSRALELGSTTKFTGTQVAGAFEIMAKAGLNVNQILAGTPGLLSAAAADGAGIEETAGSVMGAMKALGIAPEKMQLFADQMAKAGDSTAASIGSISQSLAIAGPVFKQLNVPMASAIAQIALLQDAGVDASSTGTQLASTYSKLAAPMGETKKAIATLGLKVTDAYGDMKPPDQLFDEILGATSKIKGNAGKMAAFTHLVGLESQKALLNVASAASDGRLGALTSGLNKAAGYADTLAKKRLNNLAGDITLFRANVETLATKLYDLESGPLRAVVKGTTAWLQANSAVILSGIGEKITEWTPLVKNFGDGLKDAFTDATPLIEGAAGALGVFDTGANGSRIQAYELGNNIATAAIRFGEFWLVTKAVTSATAIWSFVLGTAKVAQVAWTAAATAGRWAMMWWEIQSKAGAAATLAMSAASTVATGRLYAQAAAARVAAVGMGTLAARAGAAALAIAAVMAAKDQNDKLEQETGGKGILDVGWEWATTDKNLKQIADENLDKQAKAEASERKKKEAGRYETGTSAFDAASFVGPDRLAAAPTFDALTRQLEALDKASGQLPPGMGQTPVEAAGSGSVAGMPVAAPPSKEPPVVSLKEDSSARLSQDLGNAVKGAVRGAIVIKLKDPGKTVSGVETEGSDIVSIDPSGSF